MKNKIKIFPLIMAIISVLLVSSCSGEQSGSFTDQSTVSKSGYENSVVKTEEAVFAKDYYNWVYSEAFSDFASVSKVTKFPTALEDAIKELPDNKKISFLKSIFLPNEVSAAVLTAYEYEMEKTKYTHKVTSASKKAEGVYEMRINFQVGIENLEKIFELKLSSKSRGISLKSFDVNGNVIGIYEIIITNDGYIAVNRTNQEQNKWSAFQLMFKGGETSEGYSTYLENLASQPEEIYEKSVYVGFAGKN